MSRYHGTKLTHSAYVHAPTKKQSGTTMARAVPWRSAAAPVSGGTMAPPITPPTMKPLPRLVWRPSPRIPSATIVGKHMLSKKSVAYNIDMPVSPALCDRGCYEDDTQGQIDEEHPTRADELHQARAGETAHGEGGLRAGE